METRKLTQYSHGSGCGCKIAPADLNDILSKAGQAAISFENLLVGNGTNDDAAVMHIGNSECIISTTDFFTPIVDNPYDFGQIASANALSDVYAMGGKPLMAVAILGWPIETLGNELAAEVIKGARAQCDSAGIPLAGGHSIDSKEPFFGLAVTGLVKEANLKRNNTAEEGDLIYITKPIGNGILSTAMKRGLLDSKSISMAVNQMSTLNSVGGEFGSWSEVTAMTDITGFGLLGHLIEMCDGSGLSARINWIDIPMIDESILSPLVQKFVMPDNTMRNFKAYSPKCSKLSAQQLQILCDPQTNGGLLIAVKPSARGKMEMELTQQGLYNKPIGQFEKSEELTVIVN
ncbi:MAG: selenide, water dikinase SelD [Flavobacteriales bacterium]